LDGRWVDAPPGGNAGVAGDVVGAVRPPDGSWVAEPAEPPLRDTVSPVAALAAAVMLLCNLALT
jgi:hypothetical protein